MSRPLRALVLSDGRPGHFHLADGVCEAIRRRRPVAVTRCEIRRPHWLANRMLAATVASTRAADRQILRQLGLCAELPAADLVISAGGDTLAANVAATRLSGAHNIFCGSLRHFDPARFSLIVSSYARHAALPRHLVTLKPSGIDPDTLERDRSPTTRPSMFGLLIGGDSGLFRYTLADWNRLTRFLEESHAHSGARWIVSTSRRSPDTIGDALAVLAARADGPIADFIDFRTAGPGTLRRLFGTVDAILCTDDSSSMISEAVCARLPVVGVAPPVHAFKADEAEYRTFMAGQGWCRFIPLYALTPARFAAELQAVRPLQGNHLEQLATALETRLPQLFG